MQTTFEDGQQLAVTAAQAMEGAFTDFFFDAFQKRLKDLGDYVNGFLQAIQRAISQTLAQRFTSSFLSFVFDVPKHHTGGVIGATKFHVGGEITRQVPRFHLGGLLGDERLIIGQTGEGVISRRGMAALDKINNGQLGGTVLQVNVPVNVDGGSTGKIDQSQADALGRGLKAKVTEWLIEQKRPGGILNN